MKFTKETWRRMWRTFVQAFFGIIAGGLASALADGENWQKAIFILVACAVTEGVTAVMNLEMSESEG